MSHTHTGLCDTVRLWPSHKYPQHWFICSIKRLGLAGVCDLLNALLVFKEIILRFTVQLIALSAMFRWIIRITSNF